MKKRLLVLLLLLSACSQKASQEKDKPLLSIQLVDRHGFSETVSTKDRLAQYQNVDFLAPQPFQKILRVYGRDDQGKTHSQLTNYHANGQVSHFLEVVDGRAHGLYREWYENGQLKLEAHVIEGVADLSFIAQSSWLFDGKSQVWNEQGKSLAEIFYSKGSLEGISKYYYPSGQLQKEIPYVQNQVMGQVIVYADDSSIQEKICFQKDLKEGIAEGFWTAAQIKYKELYAQNQLKSGIYFDRKGMKVAEVSDGEGKQALFNETTLHSLVEFHHGVPEGSVQVFEDNGALQREFAIKDGQKSGEEIEYYPPNREGKALPKLLVTWQGDTLHGLVKTWYDNGVVESQRELTSNKKHGMSFAWYRDGSIMLNEEYDNDKLTSGTYFKRGEKHPVSKIDTGDGVATLYDPHGKFLKRVNYERGKPLLHTE